jgi:hypothetical protein
MSVCLGIGLVFSVAAGVEAQDKEKAAAKAAPKLERVEGTIQSVDQKAMTLTLQLSGKKETRPIAFSDKTVVTVRNAPAVSGEVQEGRRVVCLGNTDAKGQWVAARIDIRDRKK